MARVKHKNVELKVPEEKVGEYLAMGYSLLDSNGNVAKAPTKEDVPTLKSQLAILKAELEKAIAERDFEANKAQAANAELKKAKAEIKKLKEAK